MTCPLRRAVKPFKATFFLRRTIQALLTPGLDGRAFPALLLPCPNGWTLQAVLKSGLNRRTLTRVSCQCDDVLGLLQRHELGLGERHPVAMVLSHPGKVVDCRLPSLPAMADREVQGMEVRVLAHALAAFLCGERSQKEGHGLPVLLGHDGGPGRRAEYVAVLLTPVPATRMAGVKGVQPRLEQRAFVSRPDPVGSQDRELVAAVLLAQPSDEVLTVVVQRQSRSGEQGDSEGEE